VLAAQNTLWPEARKLYGHGDNLYCVSPSPDGALIASACVAKSATAALIWVWDTKDWKGVAQLAVRLKWCTIKAGSALNGCW